MKTARRFTLQKLKTISSNQSWGEFRCIYINGKRFQLQLVHNYFIWPSQNTILSISLCDVLKDLGMDHQHVNIISNDLLPRFRGVFNFLGSGTKVIWTSSRIGKRQGSRARLEPPTNSRMFQYFETKKKATHYFPHVSFSSTVLIFVNLNIMTGSSNCFSVKL